MTLVLGGVYFGYLNGTLLHSYEVLKFVYTDGTYTVISDQYSPGTDSLQCSNFGQFVTVQGLIATLTAAIQISTGGVVGYIPNPEIRGNVLC
jgi:hypothetical protein